MATVSRRCFLRAGLAGLAAAYSGTALRALGQERGERPVQDSAVRVLGPRGRVPVSLIIDDSTCLVNMAHFAMPQFAEVWPDRDAYKKPWRKMPREIPDAFVRKFVTWCAEQGVKGKYSVVPYPACVGWLDRDLPGWAHGELMASIRLVQEEVTPHFDIHPEMVSHTWVINTKTGRPYEERSAYYMENWRWTDGKSVAELADYMSYALRILKNIDLPCEGITTPGGFGNRVLAELAQATLQSCRDVYSAEVPHYFRHLFTDDRSVAPRVEYASGLESSDPRCVVSIIGCTGDWFGGWDGMTPGDVDRFITKDLASGRMVDVIARGEPAVMVCHWPGIYYNGQELGFRIFQEVVRRLHARFDNLQWMKLSEIARYWAAKQLTRIECRGSSVQFSAPFASEAYTVALDLGKVQLAGRSITGALLEVGGKHEPLRKVAGLSALDTGCYFQDGSEAVFCFDLRKGRCTLQLQVG